MSGASKPVFTPEDGFEWQDGKWHVWVQPGDRYFVYRVVKHNDCFWPKYDSGIQTTPSLGAAVTMCDMLNGQP